MLQIAEHTSRFQHPPNVFVQLPLTFMDQMVNGKARHDQIEAAKKWQRVFKGVVNDPLCSAKIRGRLFGAFSPVRHSFRVDTWDADSLDRAWPESWRNLSCWVGKSTQQQVNCRLDTSSTQRTGRLHLGDLNLRLRLARGGIHGEGLPI